jgi:hypothetical protein
VADDQSKANGQNRSAGEPVGANHFSTFLRKLAKNRASRCH